MNFGAITNKNFDDYDKYNLGVDSVQQNGQNQPATSESQATDSSYTKSIDENSLQQANIQLSPEQLMEDFNSLTDLINGIDSRDDSVLENGNNIELNSEYNDSSNQDIQYQINANLYNDLQDKIELEQAAKNPFGI